MPHWSLIPSPTMCVVNQRHFRETFPTDYWTFVSRLLSVWTTWPTRHLCTETWLQETSSWLMISYARWHNYPCGVHIVSKVLLVTTNLYVDVSVAVFKERVHVVVLDRNWILFCHVFLRVSSSLTRYSTELLLRAGLIHMQCVFTWISDVSMKRVLVLSLSEAQRYSMSNLVMHSKYMTE